MINRIKPIFIIWCAFVGHEITKEDENKLFSPTNGSKTLDTKCRVCDTPLRLTKGVGNRFKVKEKYWS